MERPLVKAIKAGKTDNFKNGTKSLADRLRIAAAFGPVHIVPPKNARMYHAKPDGTFTSDEALEAK